MRETKSNSRPKPLEIPVGPHQPGHSGEPAAVEIRLRPVDVSADAAFLSTLFACTQGDLAGLDPTVLETMISMQYASQEATYATEYPNASYFIIEADGQRVGRYIVDLRPDEIFGVDMCILPEARSRGIATAILNAQFAEAARLGLPFIFHVLKTNRAMSLYTRLGCRVTDDAGVYFRIEWRPAIV